MRTRSQQLCRLAQAISQRKCVYIVLHIRNACVCVEVGGYRLTRSSCVFVDTQPSVVHCVDILDMEEELILPFFDECIQFIHASIHGKRTAVLVHCVYGQSRSATICVAYLMATLRMSLLEAYDAVQRARPCIYINPGFLRQLELFERMDAIADHMGNTPAHAEVGDACMRNRWRLTLKHWFVSPAT